MGAQQRFVISLAEITDTDEPLAGMKAARLAMLARAVFTVPGGFCHRDLPAVPDFHSLLFSGLASSQNG
jgi:hypothetical protein